MNNLVFALTDTQTDTLVAISNEVTLRVKEAGPREAQTIILVPGWCFTADIWKKQIEAMENRYHIVAFDPRSQGRSSILNHSNSPDDRAIDIVNLINKLHIKKPILVGWSQGVQDVAAYILANGTVNISGIVLVDARVSSGAAEIDCKMLTMILGRMPIYVNYRREYIEGMMSYVFKKPLPSNEMDTIISLALQTPSSIGVTNLILDLFGKDYRPAFKRINVPTLLIVSGNAMDKNDQLQQQIPNVTTSVIEGAGHAVFYDEPKKFNELVVQFLEEKIRKVK